MDPIYQAIVDQFVAVRKSPMADQQHQIAMQQQAHAHAAGLQQNSQDAAAEQAALAQQQQDQQAGQEQPAGA